MSKNIFIILMVCLALVGLVSCTNEIEPAQEELIYVSFENRSSRALTASLEGFDVDAYFWSYEAQKSDGSGLKSGTTGWDLTGDLSVPVQSGKGLDDDNDDPVKVPGFSKGYWNFRLFAYADADRENLAYWGEVDSVLIDSGHHKASATVSPVSGGNGYLKVGTITFVPAASISAPTDLVVYTDSVWELEGDEWVLVDVQPVDGIYTLSAKQYKFTREYSFDSIPVASGSVIVTIYSNLTTTVSGSLSELTTYADFEGKQNPDVVKETWGSELIVEGTTEDVDFTRNLDPESTSKVTAATMSADTAVKKLKELADNVGADSYSSSSLKLNLNVDTTEVKKETVTYDIGMEAVLTYTKNQEQSVAKSDVKNVTDYVLIDINLTSDITGVTVTHSGENMIPTDDMSRAGKEGETDPKYVDLNKGSEEDPLWVGFYKLETTSNGQVLHIKTKSFSPFQVTYEMKDYVAAIGSVKYVTLDAAIAAASTEKTDTIIILKDITSDDGFLVNKSLNIDTNGHTITVTNGSNIINRAFQVTSGKLTVFGGGIIDAEGTATTGCYGAFRADVGTELYLEGITLKNYRNNGLNVKVLGAKAELKNVYIISENGGGIEVTDDKGADGTVLGYAKLTGCTMTQSNYHDWCSVPVSVSGNSKVDVYSTSYTGEHGVFVFSSGGIINIYGGIYTATSHGVLVTTYDQKYGNEAVINVYDGSFNGTFSIGTSGHEHLTITGGIFDHDPTAYVAEGYKANEVGDLWVVLPAVVTDDVVIISDAGVNTMSFAAFRDSVNAGNTYEGQTVELLRDIDLEGVDWTPIGTENNPFRGRFDGNNHTISSFVVSGSNYYAALFGYVEGVANSDYKDYRDIWIENELVESNIIESKYSSVIKNLNVSSANCSSNKKYAAGLVAFANDTYIYNCSVANSTISTGKIAGGLIGAINGCIVKNCTTAADVSVTATSYHAGGLIGAVNYYNGSDHYPSPRMESTIISSTNSSTITNANNGGDGGAFGGIIALFNAATDYGSVVYDCENKGNITIDNSNCSSQYRSSIGGIVGSGQGVAVLSDCKNSGSVTVVSNYNSSNTGADYYNKVGGIIGQMGNTAKIVGLINCVNSANISATVSSDRNIIGGLVASISPNSSQKACIINCANSGTVTCKDSQATDMGYVSNMVAEVYNDSGAVEYRNMQFGNLAALSNAIPKRATGYNNAKVIVDSSVTITDKSGVLTISGDVRRLKAYDGLCTHFRFEGSLLGTSGTTRSAYIDIPNSQLIIEENETLENNVLVLEADGMGIINNGVFKGGVALNGANVCVTNAATGSFVANNGNTIGLCGGSGTVINNNTTINPFENYGGVELRAQGTYTVSGVTPWVSSGYEMTKDGDVYTVVAKNN